MSPALLFHSPSGLSCHMHLHPGPMRPRYHLLELTTPCTTLERVSSSPLSFLSIRILRSLSPTKNGLDLLRQPLTACAALPWSPCAQGTDKFPPIPGPASLQLISPLLSQVSTHTPCDSHQEPPAGPWGVCPLPGFVFAHEAPSGWESHLGAELRTSLL